MQVPIDARAYRNVLGHYPTGVCAISASVDGAPVAMVIGTFTSVSLAPPLVGFLPARSSATWARLRHTERFCVNILAADQASLCQQMATRGPERFSNVCWMGGVGDTPRINGAVAWITCQIASVTEVGDHDFVLGHVLASEVARATAPLIFHRGRLVQPTRDVAD
jgi:3-hydroxy-9,10-secoandrosta-1,3,5(10)-triene-9,17-dione monooxygenase reductase component